jgi:hypothetical protein
MRQTYRSFVLALASAGALALLVAFVVPSLAEADVSAGGAATATPTATPPALQPPAAPTNLDFGGKGLVWDDNSDDEDGFRIYKTVGGGAPEVGATLPADTTSAPVPALTVDEPCAGVTFTVVAFNAAGESAPTLGADILGPICDRFPFPFPPDSGSGPAGGPTATRWLLVVAGVGLALIALGVAALRWDTRLAGGK